MILRELTASVGRTIQIVAFEPINFHSSIKAELSEDDNREECQERLFEMVKDDIRKQELELRKKLQ